MLSTQPTGGWALPYQDIRNGEDGNLAVEPTTGVLSKKCSTCPSLGFQLKTLLPTFKKLGTTPIIFCKERKRSTRQEEWDVSRFSTNVRWVNSIILTDAHLSTTKCFLAATRTPRKSHTTPGPTTGSHDLLHILKLAGWNSLLGGTKPHTTPGSNTGCHVLHIFLDQRAEKSCLAG